MTEKTELNKEELNKVSGGKCDDEKNGLYMLGKKLDQYETANYIGHEVAVLEAPDFKKSLVYGTLKKSYEKTSGCGTRRTVEVRPYVGFTTQPKSAEGYAICTVDDNHIYLIDGYFK